MKLVRDLVKMLKKMLVNFLSSGPIMPIKVIQSFGTELLKIRFENFVFFYEFC